LGSTKFITASVDILMETMDWSYELLSLRCRGHPCKQKAFAPQGLLFVRLHPCERKGEIAYLCAAAGVLANKSPLLRKAF
jgi:hypothetical protein